MQKCTPTGWLDSANQLKNSMALRSAYIFFFDTFGESLSSYNSQVIKYAMQK